MATSIAHARRAARLRRHARVRRRLSGTADRPRLSVYRSLQHIYVQVIDDTSGNTLVTASSLEPALATRVSGLKKSERAKVVGQTIAERAQAAGVTEVVFDRGGYRYHGRIRALAEAAREAGLKF